MRISHPVMWLILLVTLGSVSCRVVSDISSKNTPEPSLNYDNDMSLKFLPEILPDAQQGEFYDVKIKIENVKTFAAIFSISKGELPAGMALERVKNENAVKIIGIPQETGTFTFTLEVQCMGTNDPGQVGEKEFTMVVKPSL